MKSIVSSWHGLASAYSSHHPHTCHLASAVTQAVSSYDFGPFRFCTTVKGIFFISLFAEFFILFFSLSLTYLCHT